MARVRASRSSTVDDNYRPKRSRRRDQNGRGNWRDRGHVHAVPNAARRLCRPIDGTLRVVFRSRRTRAPPRPTVRPPSLSQISDGGTSPSTLIHSIPRPVAGNHVVEIPDYLGEAGDTTSPERSSDDPSTTLFTTTPKTGRADGRTGNCTRSTSALFPNNRDMSPPLWWTVYFEWRLTRCACRI